MARSPALERAAGRGVGPCPDLRPEEQSCGDREVGVRWRSGRGSPSRRPKLGEGGLHLDAIWIRANTQGPLKEMLESKSNPARNHHQALEVNV